MGLQREIVLIRIFFSGFFFLRIVVVFCEESVTEKVQEECTCSGGTRSVVCATPNPLR